MRAARPQANGIKISWYEAATYAVKYFWWWYRARRRPFAVRTSIFMKCMAFGTLRGLLIMATTTDGDSMAGYAPASEPNLELAQGHHCEGRHQPARSATMAIILSRKLHVSLLDTGATWFMTSNWQNAKLKVVCGRLNKNFDNFRLGHEWRYIALHYKYSRRHALSRFR